MQRVGGTEPLSRPYVIPSGIFGIGAGTRWTPFSECRYTFITPPETLFTLDGAYTPDLRSRHPSGLNRKRVQLIAGGASMLLLGVPFWLLGAHRYSTERLAFKAALAAMLVVNEIAQLAMDAVLTRFLP
jgi:hypothetical protein